MRGIHLVLKEKAVLQTSSFINSLYTFAKREQKLCNQNIERYNLDLLISDQRYGFYSDKIPSIFITHQLKFPLKELTEYLTL